MPCPYKRPAVLSIVHTPQHSRVLHTASPLQFAIEPQVQKRNTMPSLMRAFWSCWWCLVVARACTRSWCKGEWGTDGKAAKGGDGGNGAGVVCRVPTSTTHARPSWTPTALLPLNYHMPHLRNTLADPHHVAYLLLPQLHVGVKHAIVELRG
jgi:hypothetical protein